MNILLRWFINTLVLLAIAYILPGVSVASIWAAVVAALAIGVINTIVKPILVILTLPINIVTLGLFTLVLNALLLMLAALIVPGFVIAGFWSAFLAGLIFSVVHIAFHFWKK